MQLIRNNRDANFLAAAATAWCVALFVVLSALAFALQ
jgi:hypothetical protein